MLSCSYKHNAVVGAIADLRNQHVLDSMRAFELAMYLKRYDKVGILGILTRSFAFDMVCALIS